MFWTTKLVVKKESYINSFRKMKVIRILLDFEKIAQGLKHKTLVQSKVLVVLFKSV